MVVFPMIPENSHGAIGVFLCMTMWSLIEVARFGFYAIKAGGDPNGLLADIFGHLRYNLFIFAYVLGVTGECISIYYTLQVLQGLSYGDKPLTVWMPNRFNFVFDLEGFLKMSPFLYLGIFPMLYMHMWG